VDKETNQKERVSSSFQYPELPHLFTIYGSFARAVARFWLLTQALFQTPSNNKTN
jgi:hypothetical protein